MFAGKVGAFFLVSILAVSVLAGVEMFNKKGQHITSFARRNKAPKVIAERVRIVAGSGEIRLHWQPGLDIRDVTASADSSMIATITPILQDTTKTVYYYGCVIREKGRLLQIKSSGGEADTGYVNVIIFTR